MRRGLWRAVLAGLITGLVVDAALILLAEGLPEQGLPPACSGPCVALDGIAAAPPPR